LRDWFSTCLILRHHCGAVAVYSFWHISALAIKNIFECVNTVNVKIDNFKPFSWWLNLAYNTFYFNLLYNCMTHITFYTQSKKVSLTIMHCSLYTLSSFTLGRFASLDDSWSFPACHSLMHFTNRCAWKSSQYNIIIITMASFMCVSYTLVFHQSKGISTIKRILSTTAMYASRLHVCVYSLLLRCMFKV